MGLPRPLRKWPWVSINKANPQGVLRKTYLKVKPDGHEQALLKDIAELKDQG